MTPKYFFENRYSFVFDSQFTTKHTEYEVDTPETAFERSVQQQLLVANRLLLAGKYWPALDKYKRLRGLIATVINPRISVSNAGKITWSKINPNKAVDVLVSKSAYMLGKTPIAASSIPKTLLDSNVTLPANVANIFSVYEEPGVKDEDSGFGLVLNDINQAIEQKDYQTAAAMLTGASSKAVDRDLKAALLHDLAIMQEKSGMRTDALKTMQQSTRLFARNKNFDSQVNALKSMAGILQRDDDNVGATKTLKQADTLSKLHNLFPVISSGLGSGGPVGGISSIDNVRIPVDVTGNLSGGGIDIGASLPLTTSSRVATRIGDINVRSGTSSLPSLRPEMLARVATPEAVGAVALAESAPAPVMLMAPLAFANRKTRKQMTILDGAQNPIRILLNNKSAENLAKFYLQLQKTKDVGLLMGYLNGYTTTIAYMTHVYAWVIPMAIGDCHAALGSYEKAENAYLGTLGYKYLNQVVEIVNLWLRLAELYLDWGDRLYRQARNDISQFGDARDKYEIIMLLSNKLKNNSPLYKNPAFAAMKTRAANIIKALYVDRTAINDNPRIKIVLARARMRLTQIDNDLNFLGLSVQVPPFSFEYLQTLARYFAQHAAQVEQMYIQFKSTGENETLREEQMEQQVDLTVASVELEQRGVEEAEQGVDVADTNLNYTNVQRDNAIEAKTDFNDVRWELLALDSLQAWSSAAATDEDDEVRQTITGSSYYSAKKKRRSMVLYDLARQRTRISHDLEASRLQREIDSASAYRQVAQQQVQQSQARVEVAEQRVQIAEMQAQNASENLAFLTGREFSAVMWYNLARVIRGISRRYLDMAIEIATMMEMAYEAETGRDLRKIKYEYGLGSLNGLLGSEALVSDIDYFSLDYARTKSKKVPMKVSISLADQFPTGFARLLSTGKTFFETGLEYFDRRQPGIYLQKVKQVELVFVGLNGNEGIHGTLRNIGVSQFRQKDGEIVNQIYPADVMPLTEYSVRQDALVFQLDAKELRLFENNGVATMWQLELPLATNTFNLSQILDIHLVVHYDGFFNSQLEANILAALPGNGSASSGLGLRLYAPDELYYLRSQGEAELSISPELFPANQTNQVLSSYYIQATGDANTISGLNVRVSLEDLGSSFTFELDENGKADDALFADPLNNSLFDKWTFTIEAEDNPQLVIDDSLDLTGLADLAVFVEYDFEYRG